MKKSNKPLFLFVGKSGSGKSTIANMLTEKYGMKQLESYTTRPKRHEDETGHIFVAKEEFDALEDIVAYTNYAGNEYCATVAQVDECDIYIIDPDGVSSLLSTYGNQARDVVIFYLDVTGEESLRRMTKRGDSAEAIRSRIIKDIEDWWTLLTRICKQDQQFHHDRHLALYHIDTNGYSNQEVFITINQLISERGRFNWFNSNEFH